MTPPANPHRAGGSEPERLWWLADAITSLRLVLLPVLLLLMARAAELDEWSDDTQAPWIPTGRLNVLPYAVLCVAHQEEQEEA